MTQNSVLSAGALHLNQNYIYRARMLIKAPGAIATNSKVQDALAQQGFTDITFFDKSSLPVDWPADQVADPSGVFSWTAYLQGRFTLTDRAINLTELPGTVEVEDMWTYLVPLAPTVSPDAPVAPAPPLLSLPVAQPLTAPTPPPPLTSGQRFVASALGIFAGFWVGRLVFRSRKA